MGLKRLLVGKVAISLSWIGRANFGIGRDFCGAQTHHILKRSQHWVGIHWRADDLLFAFDTYPNYQKFSKFSTKSTTAAQNLRA